MHLQNRISIKNCNLKKQCQARLCCVGMLFSGFFG